MKFHEKLDFLMNITKTTNSSLAKHVSLDASHISRLRRGERRLVSDAEYLKNMSAYFIRQCVDDYQKNTLAETIKISVSLFDYPKKAAEKLYLWLIAADNSETYSVDYFLEELNKINKDNFFSNYKDISSINTVGTENDISLYYGVEGKRKAILKFFSIVLENRNPSHLLLYSDEPIDWLTENDEFQLQWLKLLSKIISQGNHIIIIHTVSRHLDEMLEAISKWMPLYMSGSIEPYYYPKKRDGIFKRTIFVAPGKAAISTNSIDPMTDKVLNILFREEKAIKSLTVEFNYYLNLCKPLMRIFTNKNENEYFSTLNEFEKKLENTVLYNRELSLITMPDNVAKSIFERSASPNINELMNYYCLRRKRFLDVIKTNKFTEIIKIDDILDIKNGFSKINNFGINELSKIRYTVSEYKDHLVNIINTLNLYDNYNLILQNIRRVEEYRFYIKEDLGAIVEKNTKPYIVFATKETNLTAAFWDYLNLMINENESDKETVIKKLEKKVYELEELLSPSDN